ncbi:RmlC-like cupin domain-containing protein, partial [Cladorrhinum sp. PSN332]
DVISTPSWSWHDHGSEGTGPMAWLDGLDLPVYRFLPVSFAENYDKERYPSILVEEGDKSGLKFPWKKAAEVLDSEGEKHARFDYKSGNGQHLSTTISAQAERVGGGHATEKARETVSFIYHVYEGEGRTRITEPGGKEEKVVEWKSRDTFSVHAWRVVQHTCTM